MKRILCLLLICLFLPSAHAAYSNPKDEFIDKVYAFFQDKPEYSDWGVDYKTDLIKLIRAYSDPDTQKEIDSILLSNESDSRSQQIDEFIFYNYTEEPDPFLVTPYYVMTAILGKDCEWTLEDFVVYSDMSLKYTDEKDVMVYSMPGNAELSPEEAVKLAREDFIRTHRPVEHFDISNYLFVPSFGVHYKNRNRTAPYYIIEIYRRVSDADPDAASEYEVDNERAVTQDGVVYVDFYTLEDTLNPEEDE